MMQDEGKVELTWSNKNRRLITLDEPDEKGLKYRWVRSSDYRVAEVRLLDEIARVGDGDNLLIRGDALHALGALNSGVAGNERLTGKVKLAYLDPPFNTGETFETYEDNLEKSVWLTMMRDRLDQVKKLLRPDGSVWVHCDDSMAGPLRVLMDQLFGTRNFVATIVWQKRTSRENRKAIGSGHDYIIVYSPIGAPGWAKIRNRLPGSESGYANPDNDPRGPWRSIPLTAQAGHATASQFYEITTPSGAVHSAPRGRAWTVTRPRFEELVADGRVYFPRGGAGKPRLKRFPWEDEGLVPMSWWPASEVGTNDEAKKEILALFPNEEPFDTPKPERLMRRIIEIATEPGELVLDPFAGSGSTPAVAHKLGRRWVAVEFLERNVEKYTMPRLSRVVRGEDPGGITQEVGDVFEGDLPEDVSADKARESARTLTTLLDYGTFAEPPIPPTMEGRLTEVTRVLRDDPAILEALVRHMASQLRAAGKTRTVRTTRWRGGGGFALLDIAPSMFAEVDGMTVLADWAIGGALAEAVAAQLGYRAEPYGPFCGRKGRSRLAVIDGLVNVHIAELLVGELADGETVLVCGTGLDPAVSPSLAHLRPGSRAQLIPQTLLAGYGKPRRWSPPIPAAAELPA